MRSISSNFLFEQIRTILHHLRVAALVQLFRHKIFPRAFKKLSIEPYGDIRKQRRSGIFGSQRKSFWRSAGWDSKSRIRNSSRIVPRRAGLPDCHSLAILRLLSRFHLDNSRRIWATLAINIGAGKSQMTLLVSWIGVDTHGPGSIYIAADSRISWTSGITYNYGRKVFALKEKIGV